MEDVMMNQIDESFFASTYAITPISMYIPPDDKFHLITVAVTENTISIDVDQEIVAAYLHDDEPSQELAIYVLKEIIGVPNE